MIREIKNLGLSVGKLAVIALTVLCALFALLAFLRIGLIYGIYTMVEDWTAVRLGFDYYVSNLLATAFTSIFTLLLPTLFWFFLLGKKQVWGIATTVGVQLLICVAIYTIGSGVCFDRRTGKPLCYFADTAKGRAWSYTPGFDPVSGKEFRLYTREIKEAEDRQNGAAKPQSSPAANRVAPVSSVSPVYENAVQAAPTPVSQKQETSPAKTIPSRSQPVRAAKEVAISQIENTARDNSADRELELERIRQAEETRRRQILEKERREAEERQRREAEIYRIRLEQERRAREQQAEQERLAREERERQIAAEREEQRRRDEKERRRMETFKTIANIAEPVIERLTRRRN